MKQTDVVTPREHHFYVAIAKHVFHHAEHGLVSVPDPIRVENAKHYGLTPLLLYGLTVAGLPIRWVTFSSLDRPRALKDVLQDGWKNAKDLRGRPDILKISRHIALAYPELKSDMASVEVEVIIAESGDQTLPASLRSAQKHQAFLFNRYKQVDRSLDGSIEYLCKHAQMDHNFHVKYGYKGSHGRVIENRIKEWLALQSRGLGIPFGTKLDWRPGQWLYSGEAMLPPNQPRYFHKGDYDGRTSLLIGEEPPQDIDDDEYLWGGTYYDNAFEIAKHLIACWPNPAKDIAKSIGITLRQLMWFTSGKAELYGFARPALLNMLGIEYDERFDAYIAAGPFVLIAKKPKALEKIYESNSGGGDANPYEILPQHGIADPSWRYIFFNASAMPKSLVMVQRGTSASEKLPYLLMNYLGIEYVPLDYYRDVVATCARACREPEANLREMKELEKRIGKYSWCPVE